MAGTLISDYAVDNDHWTELLATLEGQRKGKIALSLTNYDNSSLPAIEAGARLECNGALYGFASEEAIGGSPTTANINYIIFDPTPKTLAWSTVAPTWSASKNGWYDAGAVKRYVGGCRFDTPNYTKKWVYIDRDIRLYNMSANSVDSDQYVDGSIDAVHLASNSVDSDQYVDGSVDLVHLGTGTTETRYYSVCLVGTPDAVSPGSCHGNFAGFGAGDTIYFEVNLPDGAIVTELYSYLMNHVGGTLTIKLNRCLLTSGTIGTMATTAHSGIGAQTDTSISNATINNSAYKYYIQAYSDGSGSNLSLSGVRIKYTITKPLP